MCRTSVRVKFRVMVRVFSRAKAWDTVWVRIGIRARARVSAWFRIGIRASARLWLDLGLK